MRILDGVFVETRLDIDAADRAVLIGAQPLVHALHVEQVHARQPPAEDSREQLSPTRCGLFEENLSNQKIE